MPLSFAEPEGAEPAVSVGKRASVGSAMGKRASMSRASVMSFHEGHGEKFTSRFQFLIVLVGYAIGIGNLWRFPYLCGRYGGGTFLVPYFVGNILIACPLLIYEVALGQYFQGGPATVFAQIGPRFASVAGMQWMLTILLCCYYPMVIGYALCYAFYSLFPTSDGLLPWVTLNETSNLSSDPQAFWDEAILNKIDTIGGEGWWVPSFAPFVALTTVWIVTCGVVIGGVEAMAKIGTVMVFLPVIILLCFGIFAFQLDGAGDGIAYYVQPKVEELMSGEVWGVGISQVLFSLSPAMGPGMVFGGCNDRSHNTIVSDIIIVTVANASFSVFGGFVIFSIIGFLAKGKKAATVQALAGSGMGLAFVTIAEGVTLMPASRFVSFSFFFMLFMLGLDSLVPWAETVFHPFFEHFMKQKDFSRASIVIKGCFIMWLTGVPFTLRSGKHWMAIFDHYAPVYVLLLSAFLEYLVIIFYGTDKVIAHLEEMTTVKLPKFFIYQTLAAPFFLFVIFLYSLQGDLSGWQCTLPLEHRPVGFDTEIIPLSNKTSSLMGMVNATSLTHLSMDQLLAFAPGNMQCTSAPCPCYDESMAPVGNWSCRNTHNTSEILPLQNVTTTTVSMLFESRRLQGESTDDSEDATAGAETETGTGTGTGTETETGTGTGAETSTGTGTGAETETGTGTGTGTGIGPAPAPGLDMYCEGNWKCVGEVPTTEEHCPGMYLLFGGYPLGINIIFGWSAFLVPAGYVIYNVVTHVPSFDSEKTREIELA